MDDNGQSVYPLLDFIELVENKVPIGGGTAKTQTVKCTQNAAASIALVCSESSYDQSMLILDRLAGLDLSAMTEYRITDCVGSEFVKEVPTHIKAGKIEEISQRLSSNVLKSRIEELNRSSDKEETIKKAVEGKPSGILRKNYNGPTIKAMYVECDGTGVPGRRSELADTKGKHADGTSKTFEAKIGAVFVVEYTSDGVPLLLENGEIYRDKKVSYMGTVRKVDDFGPMLYQHALDNGLEDMDVVVFLGDGAKWVWGIQNEYFPYALTSLDLYHSTERVNALVDLLQFKGRGSAVKKQVFKDKCIKLLHYGQISDMLGMIETASSKKGNEKKLECALSYFRSNIERMDYGAFSACGVFVGSGVIEAGCKVIVGNRMKCAGMHWLKDHAEKMINLRCAVRNNVFLDHFLRNRSAIASCHAS